MLTDYLLTNEQLLPALQPVFDQFEAAGGDRSLLVPVLGVQKEFLDSAIVQMTLRFADIETYFTEGLGIDAATVATLRAHFIDPA